MSEFWYCNVCGAQNHVIDGECQYCLCGGLACKRDNCSAPEHFHAEHVREGERIDECSLCLPQHCFASKECLGDECVCPCPRCQEALEYETGHRERTV